MDVKIMVYIVVTAWWPLNKAQEVTDIYNKQIQEMGPTDFIKSAQTWLKPSKKGGISVTYNEIEEGKLDEALTWFNNFMLGFWVIDGYGYKYDLMLSQQEVLAAQQG